DHARAGSEARTAPQTHLPDATSGWRRRRRRRRSEATIAGAEAGRRRNRPAPTGEAEEERPRPQMSAPDTLEFEAEGETVGEAKWLALRELEKVQPALDRSAVVFEILSE